MGKVPQHLQQFPKCLFCRPPTHFGGCLDVKFHTILAYGCRIEVLYGYQQLHVREREQLLIAKVKH